MSLFVRFSSKNDTSMPMVGAVNSRPDESKPANARRLDGSVTSSLPQGMRITTACCFGSVYHSASESLSRCARVVKRIWLRL